MWRRLFTFSGWWNRKNTLITCLDKSISIRKGIIDYWNKQRSVAVVPTRAAALMSGTDLISIRLKDFKTTLNNLPTDKKHQYKWKCLDNFKR